MSDVNLWLLWSVIASSALLGAILLAVQLTLYLWFKRLHEDLSKVSLTLLSCASALHKIAGSSSTGEYLERQVNR